MRVGKQPLTSYMMAVMNKQANDDSHHLSWIGQ
jgi:hypothetical protein